MDRALRISLFRRIPLSLMPDDWSSAARAGAASAMGVAIALTIVDALAFRAHLPAEYVSFFTGPDQFFRIAFFMGRCFEEDFRNRLLGMTLLVVVGGFLFQDPNGAPKPAVFIGAIVITQALLVASTSTSHDTLTGFAYIACRYFAPGIVWGWLYWRYGYVVSTMAHAFTHIPFQTALSLFL